jgi:hypothetical protein
MKVCQQLLRDEIRDVGAVVPASAYEFFEKSGFGPDAMGSVVMLLCSSSYIRRQVHLDPTGQTDEALMQRAVSKRVGTALRRRAGLADIVRAQ